MLGAISLAGCVTLKGNTVQGLEGSGVASAGADASLALAATPAEADPMQVRAPEVFQASALAVWDGKRTARGIWVAHPNVRTPMQVRIVNPKTNLEVDGIVYRHRGSEAGDVLTVSSDAATALGMEPGKDHQIALYALRPARQASGSSARQRKRRPMRNLPAASVLIAKR